MIYNQLPPTTRLFVAVPLPSELKNQLSKWSLEKRKEWEFQKWVHEQDLHITLHFLGESTSDQKDQVITALANLCKEQKPFELSLNEIGTFGRVDQPRILWAGIEGDLTQLQQMQSKITNALYPIGFPTEDRPYKPHVTLARKYKANNFLLNQDNPWETMSSTWTVNQIVLYETKLRQQPMYHPISIFPF